MEVDVFVRKNERIKCVSDHLEDFGTDVLMVKHSHHIIDIHFRLV
jgi:phosphopantothenate synthetase